MRTWFGWLLIAVAPLPFFYARWLAHPVHTRDVEHAMVATAGREWLHVDLLHPLDFATYQLMPHQGCFLIDGALAALGFALFGEHYLAWLWISLLYVAVLSVSATALLRMAAGPAAGIVVPALLAASPFLLKDGMLANVGGHSTGAVMSIAALALAALAARRCGPRGAPAAPGGLIAALLAGAVVGLGAYYVRSAVLVLPAMAVVLLGSGRRAWLALFCGLLVLPALYGANVGLQHHALQTHARDGTQGAPGPREALRNVTLLPVDPGAGEASPVGKIGDVTGVGVLPYLFAQPASPRAHPIPRAATRTPASLIWYAAWLFAAVTSAVIALRWLRGQRKGDRERGRLLLALPVLGLAYAAGYVFGPGQAELPLAAGLESWRLPAPIPTHLRYLAPLLVIGLALVAQGLVLDRSLALSRERLTRAWLPLAVVLLAGTGAAAVDLWVERAPGDAASRLLPYNYLQLYSKGRGPGSGQLASSHTDDPISRGVHLRTLAAYARRTNAEIVATPGHEVWTVDSIASDHDLGPGERLFVAHGLGTFLGSAWHGSEGGWDRVQLLDTAEAAAGAMIPVEGEAYRRGVLRTFDRECGKKGDVEGLVDRYCASPTTSVCTLAGRCLLDWNGLHPPADPMALFGEAGSAVARQPEPVVREIVRGAGWSLGPRHPPSSLLEADLDPWEPGLRETFTDGWRTGASSTWRWPEADFPARPWYQP